MLCLQLFLCLGREVWFFKVTYRRNLSTLETRNTLTPWTLAVSFPAQEGALGWRSAMWSCSADCLMLLGPRVCKLKAGQWSPHQGLPLVSCLIIHQDSLPWPWLGANPSVCHLLRQWRIPSLHLHCFCEVNFILVLGAFSFSRLCKFSSSPSFYNVPSNPLASWFICHFLPICTGKGPWEAG